MKTTLNIQGTHCNSCKTLIETVAKDLPGVSSCLLDLSTGKTEIEHTQEFSLSSFIKEIESLGNYKVNL